MTVDLTRWLLACVALVLMLGAFALVLQKLQHATHRRSNIRPGGGLRILDRLSLDPRRKLVLVEHGNTQHLLLLGPGGDVVVHSGKAAPKSAIAPAPAPEKVKATS